MMDETMNQSEAVLNAPHYLGAQILSVGQGHVMQYMNRTEWTALEAYRESLREEGFRPVFESEVCGNTFLTYASDTAYAHLYYVPDTRTVRVISAPLGEVTLPDFQPTPDVDFSYPSRLTQSVLDYYYYDENEPHSRSDGKFGACYLITLDDGSLLVYDGGGKWGKNDVERIWGLICERGKRNADGKITIAGWIITHEHVDHFWCMHHVLMRHGSEIDLGAIYCTPIARDLLTGRSNGGDLYIESPDAMPKLHSAVGDFRLIRMHTGQVFYIRNIKVEVLCTPEDIFPEHADRYYDFNDTSVVTRLTVNGKTFLNLGDAYHVSSRNLVSLWGNHLRSDACTLAHHGWGGCTRSLYDHVLPRLVFVPFSKRWIDCILNETTHLSKSGKIKRRIQWAVDRYGDFQKITQHVFFDLVSGDESRFLLADGTNKTLDFTAWSVKEETTCNDQAGYPYGNP
jgi:hypothetical protein